MLKDSLGLTDDDVLWSYEIILPNGKTRILSLDGCVPVDKIADDSKRDRFHAWMKEYAFFIGIDPTIFSALNGAVFEIRQGYKSKDSKRQNADIANAVTAYAKAYLPCAVLLSSQIDADVLSRYRTERWAVVIGVEGVSNPLISTYDFMRDVIGYDLAGFFSRNSQALHTEINAVLNALLSS